MNEQINPIAAARSRREDQDAPAQRKTAASYPLYATSSAKPSF